MNKVLYIILISLFSLTIFSCAKKDEAETESAQEIVDSIPYIYEI